MGLKGRASVIQAAQMSPPESRARAGFFSMDPTLEGSGCGSSHFTPSKRVTKFSQAMGLPMVREFRRGGRGGEPRHRRLLIATGVGVFVCCPLVFLRSLLLHAPRPAPT